MANTRIDTPNSTITVPTRRCPIYRAIETPSSRTYARTRFCQMPGDYRPKFGTSARNQCEEPRLTANFDLSIVPEPSTKSRSGSNASATLLLDRGTWPRSTRIWRTPMVQSKSPEQVNELMRSWIDRGPFLAGTAGVGAGLAGFAGRAAAPGLVARRRPR